MVQEIKKSAEVMKDGYSPKQIEQLLNISAPLIRYQMDTGQWDLGVIAKGRGGHKRHIIFRAKLEQMIGRELSETELQKLEGEK